MSVNKEAMQQWIDALRSDKYEQISHQLFGDASNQACALGVALKLIDFHEGLDECEGDQAILERYGVSFISLRQGASWNDMEGKDFFEIADLLYTKYLKDPE